MGVRSTPRNEFVPNVLIGSSEPVFQAGLKLGLRA
jgi:hypothetical protein